MNLPKKKSAKSYQEALIILKSRFPELMSKTIEMALAGDMKAMCLLLGKVCPQMVTEAIQGDEIERRDSNESEPGGQ